MMDEERNSVLREAMSEIKVEVKLIGEMCIDDSDKNLPMVWTRGKYTGGMPCLVCWQITNPAAPKLKDMVGDWDRFIILSEAGKPLGTAREFFLVHTDDDKSFAENSKL